VGFVARRNDSVLPAQSWNSSQTTTGFTFFSSAAAILAPADRGSESAAATPAQKVKKLRRETPRLASSRRRKLLWPMRDLLW
jgi:hypothetical protein